MKIGTIKRPSREDIAKGGGEIPKWLDLLLQPIGEFFEKVGSAIQGQLTFEDNFLCKVARQTFTHQVELEVNPFPANRRNLRVTGVILTDANGEGIDKFRWSRKDNGNIGVTVDFDGGTSATSAICTLIIILG